MIKKLTPLLIALVVLSAISFLLSLVVPGQDAESRVDSFEDCVDAGNPVMESYPRQCRHGDEVFVEDIGNLVEKTDLIRLGSPRPSQKVKSPLSLEGEARGTWFFEGDFPVQLIKKDGTIVGASFATAESEARNEDFVQFSGRLEFAVERQTKADLILKKDNPSGLPENDDFLRVPIILLPSVGE